MRRKGAQNKNMQIDVGQLLTETIGAKLDLKVEDEMFGDDEIQLQRVNGTVHLTRTDSGIWASGTLRGLLSQVCSRCLEEFYEAVNLPIEQDFSRDAVQPVALLAVETESPLGEVFLSRDNTLNIVDIVRQSAIGNSPLKPLCDPDCAGLCCNCGINLNATLCECTSEVLAMYSSPLTLLASMKLFNSTLENR